MQEGRLIRCCVGMILEIVSSGGQHRSFPWKMGIFYYQGQCYCCRESSQELVSPGEGNCGGHNAVLGEAHQVQGQACVSPG